MLATMLLKQKANLVLVVHVTINGEKYFCTKEDIKDLSYSIILKDKNNKIVIENSFNNDLYVDDNVIFWVDKHKISEELYN